MEVSSPIWSSQTQTYTFTINTTTSVTNTTVFNYLTNSTVQPPLPDDLTPTGRSILTEFIGKTKRYFTTPLVIESVMKRLRHELYPGQYPPTEGNFNYRLSPRSLKVQRDSFTLVWVVIDWIPDETIPEGFIGTMTPRAQSPEQEIRQIQIQETLPTYGGTSEMNLEQINDLPLSDLPPLSFEMDTELPTRRETEKQRIREARLKVALAKLKAQRMVQKFYTKYGETLEDDSDSELSLDSDETEDYAH